MSIRSRLDSFRDDMHPILREARFLVGRFKKDRFSLVGIAVMVVFSGIALMAPVLAPPEPGADPYILRIREDWKGAPGITPPPTVPGPEHPFGTLGGYDLYYGCIWGTRTAFRIGLEVTLLALAIGIIVGCLAGYYGGILDELLMRLTDIFFGLPSLLFAMLLIVATMPRLWGSPPVELYAYARMQRIILALALTGWPTYARLIRGEVMKIKNENYVEAAQAVGCSNLRIVGVHILPNAISPVIAMASLNVGGVILAVATLSFLGVGIPVGYAAWTPFIASSRHFIVSIHSQYTYTFVIPGAFLVAFILGWTLLGDTLRDIQDPRTRRM